MTTKRIEIVEAVPDQVLGPITDDGERYWQQVWVIVAHTSDCGPMCVHFTVWHTQKSAEWFAAKVEKAGRINLDYWTMDRPHDELPDYVLNPWRPEYN